MSKNLGFARDSREYLKNAQLRINLHNATATIRSKRASVVGEIADWEQVRERGKRIKDYSLANLDSLLLELQDSVESKGGKVHFAPSSKDANEIIGSIVASHNSRQVIKVKSLTTDEIELNSYLESLGVTVYETDLAELIVQLAHDKPSHILVPAIHKNRSEIRELFENTIARGNKLGDSPTEIAEAARLYLREKFLTTDIAISGANFAVAESGTICIVESEGNGRMCTTLSNVLISVMGIEKVIPKFEDLAVMFKLLPRSSTGERMNPYTSLWSGVYEDDGPQEFHLIVLDNNRSEVLSDPMTRQTLRCIRCSACLNVCPVYERVGGHAYGTVYPGPIGAILSPQLFGSEVSGTLPWASTLCGACYEVCPVKIDIPSVLVELREKMVSKGVTSGAERFSFGIAATILSSRFLFELSEKLLATIGRFPRILNGLASTFPVLHTWTSTRELPEIPKRSFRHSQSKEGI